jgi:hypothetical protein
VESLQKCDEFGLLHRTYRPDLFQHDVQAVLLNFSKPHFPVGFEPVEGRVSRTLAGAFEGLLDCRVAGTTRIMRGGQVVVRAKMPPASTPRPNEPTMCTTYSPFRPVGRACQHWVSISAPLCLCAQAPRSDGGRIAAAIAAIVRTRIGLTRHVPGNSAEKSAQG